MYDSRPDTYTHIARVRELLNVCVVELLHRGERHDQTKLESPELEAFDVMTPRLKTTVYGTDEYRATLREMKPAIQHHNEHNSHHPEHYPEGIAGMDLFDLLEMVCDWKAAGERHTDNAGIEHSIEINQQRFGYSDEVRSILLNTVRRRPWLTMPRSDKT